MRTFITQQNRPVLTTQHSKVLGDVYGCNSRKQINVLAVLVRRPNLNRIIREPTHVVRIVLERLDVAPKVVLPNKGVINFVFKFGLGKRLNYNYIIALYQIVFLR